LLDKDKDGFLSFPEFSLLAKGNINEINKTAKIKKELNLSHKNIRKIPAANASIIGDLLLGKIPDYNKYKSYVLNEDEEEIKIYPVDKRDWRGAEKRNINNKNKIIEEENKFLAEKQNRLNKTKKFIKIRSISSIKSRSNLSKNMNNF